VATQERRRITLKQIADTLGVSTATVSNAFNRPDQLSAELRQRILDESARQGFHGPDAAARSLRRGRSAAIGVLYTDRLSYAFADPGAVLFLQGVSTACERTGNELVLIPRTSGARAGGTAVGRSVVDGIVAYSVADDDPVLAEAVARRMPVVVVDQPHAPTRWWVGTADRDGCRAVAEHLVDLGHRRFAVIGTELTRRRRGGLASLARQRAATFATTTARLDGYRDAITAAGVPWADVPVFEAVENSVAQGQLAAEALLATSPRPTAVLAMTDQLAFGACAAASRLGLDVPGDVSVAGFDDLPAAATHQPPLTTVHQPHREKGRVAADLLLDLLSGDGTEPTARTLPATLQVRGSTAPPG
jgi:DNA-binding LacI/PurR family transcriptional regulator